jgi:hypothetical protein
MQRTGTTLILRLTRGDPPGRCLEDSIFQGERPPDPPKAEVTAPKIREKTGHGPTAGSTAQSEQMWNHNGSLVRLVSKGTARRFYYESPREGMLREGVAPGTLLFEGTRRGDTYSGRAYVFSAVCGSRSYAVSGTASSDDRVVTMVGQAPRLNVACEVVGYRPDTLVFVYLGPKGRF